MKPYYEDLERLQEWKKRITAMTRAEEICYDNGHADGFKLGKETATEAYGRSDAELVEAAKEVLWYLHWGNNPAPPPGSIALRLRDAVTKAEARKYPQNPPSTQLT